jgi:hypothetical protein
MFAPFRSIGVVCGEHAAAVAHLGVKTFLSVPVAASVHIYDADTLSLRMVTNSTPYDVE